MRFATIPFPIWSLVVAKTDEAQPQYQIEYREIQAFGTLKDLPLGLSDNARKQSVSILNQVLADTMMLRDLYKKHHWQMSGATFFGSHTLKRWRVTACRSFSPA